MGINAYKTTIYYSFMTLLCNDDFQYSELPTPDTFPKFSGFVLLTIKLCQIIIQMCIFHSL